MTRRYGAVGCLPALGLCIILSLLATIIGAAATAFTTGTAPDLSGGRVLLVAVPVLAVLTLLYWIARKPTRNVPPEPSPPPAPPAPPRPPEPPKPQSYYSNRR
jgi:hypothetical protein